MAAETQVTISATGQTDVVVWTTKLDHNLTKPVINIPVPRQKAAMDSETAPTSYLIDIGRISEAISVQGMLVDDASSAIVKKANLLKIAYYERSVTITWGTGARAQTYTGNISKIMITETAGIVGVQPSGYEQDKNFAIQLTLMVGEEK